MAYVSKNRASEELMDAIEAVINEKIYYSEDVQRNIKEHKHHLSKHNFDSLTDRELQVFKLLAKGFSMKAIAKELDIQHKTAHVHKANLLSKLNLSNSQEIMHAAIKAGYVTVDELLNS
jgi:two-component system uhpT operon response regulator UhpA